MSKNVAIITFATVLVAVMVPFAAEANAYADLNQVKAAFDSARSWHATERMSNGHTVMVDYVAPDRWRIQIAPNITEILIGNAVYMVMNGRTMHLAFAAPQIHQIVNQYWFRVTPEVRRTLRDRGWRNVGAMRLHEYTYTANGDPVQLYVGANALPERAIVQTRSGTITIIYSQYNARIAINP